ncbi:MAG: hypothetical protein A2283_17780 [Lentisphaerae bacterium RIFOXYA12_FULL_48_11]|nr:MAG: hypothetical protein A2283_17780 [Lentisphaerae bacterium RIFOXYA12_FULL_48_11]
MSSPQPVAKGHDFVRTLRNKRQLRRNPRLTFFVASGSSEVISIRKSVVETSSTYQTDWSQDSA